MTNDSRISLQIPTSQLILTRGLGLICGIGGQCCECLLSAVPAFRQKHNVQKAAIGKNTANWRFVRNSVVTPISANVW